MNRMPRLRHVLTAAEPAAAAAIAGPEGLGGALRVAPSYPEADAGEPGRRGGRSVARRLRGSPAFLTGGTIVVFWVVCAIFWRLIVPYSPFTTNPFGALRPPNGMHWLGTDELGRDVLSRVLAGAAPVLTVAPIATALAVACGTVLGLAAGYYRGLLDDLLMRIVDTLLVLPGLIIAVVVIGIAGPSVVSVILLVGLSFSPRHAAIQATRDLSSSPPIAAPGGRPGGRVLPPCAGTVPGTGAR